MHLTVKVLRAVTLLCVWDNLIYNTRLCILWGTHIKSKVTLLLILIEGDLYVVILCKEQVVCSIAIMSEVISGSLSLSQTSAHSFY